MLMYVSLTNREMLV